MMVSLLMIFCSAYIAFGRFLWLESGSIVLFGGWDGGEKSKMAGYVPFCVLLFCSVWGVLSLVLWWVIGDIILV